MGPEDFWQLVENARAEGGTDTELVAQALLRRLRPDPWIERPWTRGMG